MASGVFAILDDIAALMDDVAVASKMAAKKTAGLLGDDLAVNAEKATGFLSSRELPVLWAITKGSFINKLIIIPAVMLLNYFLPQVITIILIIGGCYLAYEGMEKIIEYFFHKKKEGAEVIQDTVEEDGAAAEKAKVKSAILTDFILSVEIIIIALSTVMEEPLSVQILTVSVIAIVATIGVYGLVALIVRMDDAGYNLIKKANDAGKKSILGEGLVKGLPLVIKGLTIIGTIALLLVSGGIFSHNLDFLHNFLATWPTMLKEFTLGIIGGTLVWALITPIKKIFTKKEVV